MSADPLPHRDAHGARPLRPRVSIREAARATSKIEPTFFSRYECKYLVDPIVIPEMRRFLNPFVEPDNFAALRKGYRYPICSLYLDSPDLALYHQTVAGEKDRFKLRVRTYSDDPSKPAYFEVKRKVNNIVHKRRAGLSRAQARAELERAPVDLTGMPAAKRSDVEYFRHHLMLTEARPVVRVKYMREAYQARGNEPVRIDPEGGHKVVSIFLPHLPKPGDRGEGKHDRRQDDLFKVPTEFLFQQEVRSEDAGEKDHRHRTLGQHGKT